MIKLTEDTITQNNISALIEWLQHNPKLTKGPLTLEFEKLWSQRVEVSYSVFVNSGSSANLLMAAALLESGRLKNNKIIVPAVSWVTTVAPFIQLGFEPILCDCDPDNLGISIPHLEKLVKEHDPGAMVMVHVLGYANHIDEIQNICSANNMLMMEDCCEAHGSTYKQKPVGSYGIMSTFSFYYGHHMSTIEGGMICTSDEEIYNILKILRSHGWTRDLDPKARVKYLQPYNIGEFDALYYFVAAGFNVRSSDLNAFLGLEQLKTFDANIDKRKFNLQIYYNRLKEKCWLQSSAYCDAVPLAFGLIDRNRNQIVTKMQEANVECRPLICGSIGQQPFWTRKYGYTNLPNADLVHNHGLYLPCHHTLKEEDIHFICDIIIKSL
jgi:CDP-6-deoxy-D-xylo-4-hexulose-3-dehydrase